MLREGGGGVFGHQIYIINVWHGKNTRGKERKEGRQLVKENNSPLLLGI